MAHLSIRPKFGIQGPHLTISFSTTYSHQVYRRQYCDVSFDHFSSVIKWKKLLNSNANVFVPYWVILSN